MKTLFLIIAAVVLLALLALLVVSAAGGVGLVLVKFLPLSFATATVLALSAMIAIAAMVAAGLMFGGLMSSAEATREEGESSRQEGIVAAIAEELTWQPPPRRTARRVTRRPKREGPDEGG